MKTKKESEEITHILFVLDRSGSMSVMMSAVIEGFNKMMVEQRALKAPCFVTLVLFDDKYKEVFVDMPLDEVPTLTSSVCFPGGDTALRDALGRACSSLAARIDALPQAKRPSRVIVVTHTDGRENSSKEWTAERLKALVKDQEEEGGWLFVFAGANIDAFGAGEQMGMHRASTVGYVGTAKGASALYGATSQAVMRSRQMAPDKYKSVVRGASAMFNAAEVKAMATADSSALGGISDAASIDLRLLAAAQQARSKKAPKRSR